MKVKLIKSLRVVFHGQVLFRIDYLLAMLSAQVRFIVVFLLFLVTVFTYLEEILECLILFLFSLDLHCEKSLFFRLVYCA